MWHRSTFLGLLALASLICAQAACSRPRALGPGPTSLQPGPDGGPPGALAPAAPMGALSITPAGPTVDVTVGQPIPTLGLSASIDGQSVSATWQIDRGEIGTIDEQSGVFTPSGTTAGVAHVTAFYGAQKASAQVTVKLTWAQNGDPAATGKAVAVSAGGYGGVGGDGPGLAASPAQTQALMGGTPTADPSIAMLYPYDKTVWPRGLLAPLLQWSSGTHVFDSALVHLHEDNFDWQGTFATPAGASKGFINLPIPQAVWQAATYSNGGEPLVVTVVLGEKGATIGPLTESWNIAQGTLKGTVYYNSYGTSLVANSYDNDYNGHQYGAGTLAIEPGASDPVLVAGTDTAESTGGTGCRVCHSVSANGQTLLSQHGNNYNVSSIYNLLATPPNSSEATLPSEGLAFPALYPDGSLLLSSAGGMPWHDSTSQLYSLPDGQKLSSARLPANFEATLPVFSPDGKHVAFNFWGGAGADQKSLAMMDFDLAGRAFSNLQTLYTPAGGRPVSWSAFLPTSTGILFEVELNDSSNYGFTWSGNTGELWWVDTASKTAARLDALNGLDALPAGPNHPNDKNQEAELDYEPTMSPIVSGGYAWVVFTSRRMYGNVSTEGPWTSDPRDYDWSTKVTPKKLWVAAIDLNAPPGTDPSHPAFYLPAQELRAGNSRGFWSVSPCQQAGTSCSTGDQCCGGYCRAGQGGALQCTSQTPTCANEFEKCATDADCCAGQSLTCVNNRCARTQIQIK